ncbi:MAG: arginine repressor [Bacillota bacterium]|jgi:transcriptional regulator of arginine metabolism|nr:arginine repressor [Bacillota bacterium]HHU42887.1 arginine repressor [Clostridiales bacterium]
MSRKQRQAKILELISEKAIETQSELMEELYKNGYKTTQATVSRDIKDLGLVKTAFNNRYRYVYPDNNNRQDRFLAIFKQSIISIDKAMNLVVLKTVSGAANSACMAIDTLNEPAIAGTLAGDDTFVVIVKNLGEIDKIYNKLKDMMTDK